MGTTLNVALVPRGVSVDPSELSSVAAALSLQVARDFSPIWGVSATVTAFPSPKNVPLGYSPIFIEDPSKLPQGAGGVHLDNNNQPYALIELGAQWSLDASHELLELLVDPGGNRLHAGPLLQQAINLGQPVSQVQYLVEVADPVEDGSFGYQINGVLVSDFFTPNFYDAQAAPGVRYDFTGGVSGPLQVGINGYITWFDSSQTAWQLLNFADPTTGLLTPTIRNLSSTADFQDILNREGLRPAVDRVTHPISPDLKKSITPEHRAVREAKLAAAKSASNEHALGLEKEIESVIAYYRNKE
jgi:hypothetical protein